ncbi:MAG TPA: murein L,D-transpeptidase catalytic domain family protein [Thermoanaerobaculia bacterium]
MLHLFLLAASLLAPASPAAVAPPAAAGTMAAPSETSLRAQIPRASYAALAASLQAWRRAVAAGAAVRSDVLTVIDYTRPSNEPRLFVIDVPKSRVRFTELVAHGRDSGGNATEHFSNAEGSHMSSLGVFRAADAYRGEHGLSLHLDGLEPGFNDRARDRAIVIHGAHYVSAEAVAALGRLGRSWGCPAVRPSFAKRLIDTIKDGSLIVAYYPDVDWLARSAFLASPITAPPPPTADPS